MQTAGDEGLASSPLYCGQVTQGRLAAFSIQVKGVDASGKVTSHDNVHVAAGHVVDERPLSLCLGDLFKEFKAAWEESRPSASFRRWLMRS